ncbi:hypothetical protein CDL12_18777 [Handroanthus impetiginosus]|uniref:Uncharacterized protein n=1 Tax=Handroanthus impetiginosus TaxID=429701 RepID=A0A2G9GTP0_9LAMI|nr:hypothetical protein CDL12_18777 [Handroanthus impetiginosus]
MAGMLPGVEAARRRRFHISNPTELSPSTPGSFTRRSSFCLYAGNHEFQLNSSMPRNPIISQQGLNDESRLGATAREAKKRLDERLQQQWKTSETKRYSLSLYL